MFEDWGVEIFIHIVMTQNICVNNISNNNNTFNVKSIKKI